MFIVMKKVIVIFIKIRREPLTPNRKLFILPTDLFFGVFEPVETTETVTHTRADKNRLLCSPVLNLSYLYYKE